MKTNYLTLFSFIITSIFMSSCENENDSFTKENLTISTQNCINKSDPAIIKLINRGYKLENIKNINNYYLVEDDILFNKSISNATSKPSQVHSNQLVDMNAVTNILVRVHSSIPTSGTDNWRSAISTALNDWNSVQGSRINFILTTNLNSNILIGSDEGILPNGVAAAAFMPVGGAPGSQIAINLDARNDVALSEAEKVHVIQHELGHTLGFQHTNYGYLGESNSSGYNNIPGTPSGFGTNQDYNSVMNSNVPYSNGFSNYDVFAFKYLYPDTYSISELIYSPIESESIISGSNFLSLTWRASFIQEQNIKIEIYRDGQLETSATIPNTGDTTIFCRSAKYKVRLSSISNPMLYDEVNFGYTLD